MTPTPARADFLVAFATIAGDASMPKASRHPRRSKKPVATPLLSRTCGSKVGRVHLAGVSLRSSCQEAGDGLLESQIQMGMPSLDQRQRLQQLFFPEVVRDATVIDKLRASRMRARIRLALNDGRIRPCAGYG